jgi:hypothetical protein
VIIFITLMHFGTRAHLVATSVIMTLQMRNREDCLLPNAQPAQAGIK